MSGNTDEDISNPGKFYHDTIEHRFLFEPDVWRYFAELFERASRVRSTKADLEHRPNIPEAEEKALKKQLRDDLVWFFHQTDEIFKVFSKDLSIKSLR